LANQDTELTLSTGKLLGIFFGMVAICGVFFSLGYAVGKGAGQAGAQVITDSSELSALSPTGGAKPAPGKTGVPPPATKDCVAGTSDCDTPANGTGSDAQGSAPATTASEEKSDADTKTASAPPPELTAMPSAGYMVQVAAVSKREDAESLVNALRKKQYPVLLVNNQANSSLFHVQVGPFAQLKEAEAMRTKLAGDGYNAILKK
jgi:DedD protein